jgi:hypothetical protein
MVFFCTAVTVVNTLTTNICGSKSHSSSVLPSLLYVLPSTFSLLPSPFTLLPSTFTRVLHVLPFILPGAFWVKICPCCRDVLEGEEADFDEEMRNHQAQKEMNAAADRV